MAYKVKSHLDVEGYLTSKSRLIVEGNLYDNNLSTGTNGQVLSKDASGNVIWADAQGASGTVDGTGTANKLAYWTDSDTIDDTTLHWDNVNGRLGIGDTTPSYPLDIASETSFGGGTLHYDNITKRIGIHTVSPSEKLDVNGNIRLRSGLKDSSNSTGSAGQILKSTGSATSWTDLSDIGYVQNYRFADSNKIGTSGTKVMNWSGEGSQNSMSYFTSIFAPTNGTLRAVRIISAGTYSGVTIALYDSGTQIYSSGTINVTANTPYNLNSLTTSISQGDQLNFRYTYPTQTNNHEFQIVAVIEWDA